MRFSWLWSSLGLRKLSRRERRYLKRRRSYVPLRIERLEDRLAPNVSWTGGAGTLNWTDANNWSSHAVPGATDDVTINSAVSGSIIITGAQSINSLTDTTASLDLSSGSLTLAANSSLSQNFTLSNGTLTPNSGLTINGATFNFDGGTIGGTVTLSNSALVIGPGSTGAANFVLQGSDTLTGNVAAGQTLTVQGNNAAGNATLRDVGNVTNDGTIVLESINTNWNETLNIGSGTFTNAADGTIQASQGSNGGRTISGTLVNQGQISVDSGSLLNITGTYDADGGNISGPGYVVNSTLNILASPTNPTTILVGGGDVTLATDNLANTTIWVQGNNAFGNAVLTVAPSLVNHGTILLESINTNWNETLTTGSGTFTNAADGTIQAIANSGGGRTITGILDNKGQFSVDTSSLLTIQGTYDADGGNISGPGYLVNATLNVLASPSSPTTIMVGGGNVTLATDNLANTTIWVQGNSYNGFGNATLTVDDGLTNHGTILLESLNTNWNETLNIGSGTFTNAADGTIQAINNSGGGRTITGTLVNQGLVTVDTTSLLTIQGQYYAAGGNITGPGYLYNSTLYVTATPLAPTTILVGGGNVTLATDNLANTTIWVQGNSYNGLGNATLTVDDGVINYGTILLESINTNWSETLNTGSGTLTNAAIGTIQVSAGNGGARTITGTFINNGLVSIAGDTLTATGNSFTNEAGGLVSGYGTFSTSGVALVDNGIIDMTSAPSILGVLIGQSAISITYYSTGGMDPASVTNPANYTIIRSGGDDIFGNGNDANLNSLISSITYDSTTGRAILNFSSPLPSDFYQVSVNGAAIKDNSGNALYASGTISIIRVLSMSSFTLFGTGFDNAGDLLPTGAVDPHYTLISSADPTLPGPSTYVVNTPLPTNWLADNFYCQWISAQAGNSASAAPGYYTYQTTIDLTGVDPNTVAISGLWSTDDLGGAILLNGVNTGNVIDGSSLTFQALHRFTITSGFQPGINTLDFVVQNLLSSSNPTGLRVEMVGTTPAVVGISLDPASDSGASNHDGLTSITNPTFDVKVNQAGTITVDFDGNPAHDQTFTALAAGTYQFTAPTLADGNYTATATFTAGTVGTVLSTTQYAIDTVPPTVTSLTPSGTVYNGVSQATITFSKPIDLNTLTPAAFTLTGPNGTIAVDQSQLVSGNTYSISFAPQTMQGSYTLTLASTIADLAGNTLTQPFTGSFAVALPDLAVTTASAPSSTVPGASIPLSWTVENLSPTNPAISTWTDTVYLSTDAVLDNTATALISETAPPQSPLAGLGMYTFNETASLPNSIATGNYYLLFVANANAGQTESDASDDTNDLFAEPITVLPTAQTSLSLDPASDSGTPDHPGFTNVTAPTFDVQVNQAGTITMDFDGNAAHDQTLTVTAAGTYQFTAPTLADGAYTATATFNAGAAGTAQSSTSFTIDTQGPYVTSMSPTGTINLSATQAMVTFSEPIDLNTLTPSAITLIGPNGPIPVNQPQLVTGNTRSLGFATQITDGVYTLTIAPSVTDYAGNEMDQNQNGINGEPTDSFTGSFTMNLPVGGPITLNTPTLGFVPSNKVDDWTFFGRAGQAITAVVDPGAPGTTLPPPSLDYVQLTLLDPNGNVLGTISNSQSGATAALTSITLPADGTYHVQVQASAANPGGTGFYNLTVADATVHQTPIAFNEPVTGALEDQYSSDQWTFSAAANQVVQFDLLNVANPDIEFDLTGPNGYSGFINATTSSGQIVLPTAGNYTLTVHTSGQPGAYAFELMQPTVTNLALNTPYQVALAGSGQAQLFAVTVGAANPLEISLTDANQADHNEVYVSYGTIPTRESYQYRYTGGAGANQTVALTAKPGIYYILVYNNLVTSPGSYTIEADSAAFLLSGMNPTKIGNAGNTTVQLSGVFPLSTGNGGYVLSTAPTLQLIDANGNVYPTAPIPLIPPPFGTAGGLTGGVNPDGTMTVSAVIPGSMLLPGTYSVRVTDDSGYSQTLSDVLTVVQGGFGILKTNVIVPNPIGYHIASTIYVQYSNVGDAPMAAPLLVLTATQNGVAGALMTLDASKQVSGFWTSATPDGYSQSVQFLASGAMPGVLQPGESETVPVYYAGWLRNQWDFARPPINFSLGVLDTSNTQTIDWTSLQSSLQPPSLSPAAWNALYPNLTAQFGSTWGQYVQQLDNDAEYLGSLGENVTDIGQLFNFEVQQANGYSPLSSLASATDAQVAAPGLPLSFARTFAPGVIARNQFGRFGWGWSDSWDTHLTVDSDGSVNVFGPDGSLRRFQPDSRGGYFDQPGDHGTLAALPGGGYTLTELNGQVTAYNADGTLNFVEDTNGNSIVASYSNGQLTKLTHSSGQFLSLTYNSAGLISSITDSAGRTTTYNYDPTDQYLTSVADFDGQTTSYTYDQGSNPATAHALLSVTHSDGTHDYFSYDAQGRLADAHRDGGAEDTTFSYSEGQVGVTDTLGDTTHYFFDNRGLLVQVENPLQNTVHYTYDSNLNLIQTTDAAGQVYTNTYDAYGDLLSTTDPLGHTVTYAYNCNDDTLASVTDGNGNTTLYAYDGEGNLTSTTYADGTVESVAYDPIGNVISSTDQMGQVTKYTHDAAGNILTETFADGSETVFTYDAHENLTSATDASGTTVLTYDANDRLIQITYPSGHYLKYSYDAAGRRTQMVDDTGFTVNYSYDDVGSLATLTDGSGNLIVRYTYDAAGRLSREDHGNGTYVTYQYDAAGELLHLVNYAPDSSINSRFDYTYDSLGRRITEATSDGTWTYSYDAIGELTHAVFISTNLAIANQDLAYNYDAAGNRTQTVINGVTTVYSTNNMNEYTQVGDTTYTYNADGDMSSASDASGTTNYAYNVQNQLVGVTGPTETWTYQYDAFGNRVATTQNGQTTQSLVDPTGLGNVVATFNSNDALLYHYTYGLRLTSQVTASNGIAYYDFDAIGATVGISGPSGSYSQTYAYSPFGQILATVGSDVNPFQFAGQFGVQTDENGLVFLRTRYYDPNLGRFTSPDPLRFGGGDANFYRYSANSPLDYVDPTGKQFFARLLAPIVITVFSFSAQLDGYGMAQPPEALVKLIEQGENNVDNYVEFEEQLEELESESNVLQEANLLAQSQSVVVSSEPEVIALQSGIRGGSLLGLAASIFAADYWIYEHPSEVVSWELGALDFLEGPVVPGKSVEFVFVKSVNSHDPNSKIGPSGYGSQDFVSDTSTFPYHIDFENDPTATAPAQRVDVTDQLDPNLDWSTLQWTGFGFGNTVIAVPPNTQHYETTVPMTYNGVTFRVVITLDLDPQTGMVHASFQSLNAANLMTGPAQCPGTLSLGPTNPEAELPPPVTIGFLPPEDGTGRGMGYLTYTVKPKSDLTTGTQIRNVANVTFDLGNTIATDQVSETDPTQGVDPTKQDLVTIDSVPPTSSVAALPAVSTTNAFTVTWSGQDDSSGSGIASYSIYVSDNGGAFTPWMTNTKQTSATYIGLDGHTYGFYSIATDNVGNVEATPTAAQATTTVDATPPTSSVAALPQFSPGSFTLNWSGSSANGIGITSYSVYVSDDGGAFTPLLTNTTQTSTTFTGVNGHTYGFYSIATDTLGNIQPTPASAQATTTVDSVAPTSSVGPLPAFVLPTFTVSWSGSDNSGGSGLASYSVYVSDNGGAFAPLLTDTTQTSTSFTGVDGHTYSFYSVATDNVGNVQATPTSAQASTTADATPPTSSVAALPAFSPGSFTLNWSGSDGSGSGIATYSIYVSDNGGAFMPLLTDTKQTSTTFTGVNGHTYGFYSIATDNVGNIQPTPTSAQASTMVQGTPTVTVTDAGGTYTGNPFPASATAVGIDGVTPVSGSFSYTYYVGSGTSGTSLGSTAPTNAGTYTVVATFTSSDPDYSSGGTAQTTFTISKAKLAVTSTADDGSLGTLRYALTQANSGNFNEIDFAIGAVGSAQTIQLTSALPTLTASGVSINGLSQGGNGNTKRLITLDGTGAGSSDGLILAGTNWIVSGLIIENFSANGIEVEGANNTIGGTAAGAGNVISGNSNDGVLLASSASGVQVQGNSIGINTAGTAALANEVGIEDAGSSNTLGGSVLGARNVISGNSGDGILLDSTATAETVQGNYIGLDSSGKAALANGSNGVEVQGTNNTIGGTTTGADNIISGNTKDGVLIDNGATGVQVQGNFIGTNTAGSTAMANSVGIEAASGANTIGGTTSGARNVISGNRTGVLIDSGVSAVQVQGNYIGTDGTGANAVANLTGVDVEGSNNTIGGTATAARNVISGNSDGVYIVSGASGVAVQGNYIGTDATGAKSIANSVGVDFASSNNTLGGSSLTAGNIISGNTSDGVLIDSGVSGVTVQGNYIGTNTAGSASLANKVGIEIAGNNNTIGSSVSGVRNIISGNGGDGVLIDNGASGNMVSGNILGLNASGNAALANSGNGVNIQGTNNTVGGPVFAARNYISGNAKDGVLLGSSTSGNQLLDNFIGLDLSGTHGVANLNGVEIAGSSNTIGSTVSGGINFISANSNDGVLIDSTAKSNLVQSNDVGTDYTGQNAVANSTGIEVAGAGNTVGGTASAARNIVSGNTQDGVHLDGAASGTLLLGNCIGVNSLDAALGNGGNGLNVLSTTNTIGGTTSGAQNVLSGNNNDGLLLGSAASGNQVLGNFIGLNIYGNAALGNRGNGIEVAGTGNTVGGGSGSRNLISGNANDGVKIDSGGSGNVVLGNYLGVNTYDLAVVGNSGNGIEVAGSHNTIGASYAVAPNEISGNAGDGVLLDSTSSGNQVLGNYIGTNHARTAAMGNKVGVEDAGSNNTLGGSVLGARNVISGNSGDGVLLDSSATAETMQGNYIGLNVGGNTALANGANGVEVQGKGNTIGGNAANYYVRNFVSGNDNDGVLLDSGASGNQVLGNFIGLGVSGTTRVSNAANGIEIASSSNTIGGTVSGDRNAVSGNGKDGVLIDGAGANNLLQGNYVGTDYTGHIALANSSNGIEIQGTGNTVGGGSGSRNLISGNANDGVKIDSGGSGNLVEGNYIGVNTYDLAALGNSGNGIEVAGNSNTLGASYAVAPNEISGNAGDGVLLDSTSSGNQVLGNYIGTNHGGTASVANKIGIEDAGSSNTIGGSVLGARNVISGNTVDGVLLDSSATAETIEGNYVGLNYNGKSALANGSNGVEVRGSKNFIGGNSGSNYFTRNFLSGNTGDGLLIANGATGNVVQGNFIGIDVSGTNGVGNSIGIEVAGTSNTLGGASFGLGNVLSGNRSDGLRLDSSANNNVVQRSLVGTNYNGTSAVSNGGNGVTIVGNNNTLGGSVAAAGNTIAYNSGDGVLVSVGVGNTITSNSIFSNTGVGIALSNGGNNTLAAPNLLTAVLSGSTLTVTGSFTVPTANVGYVLQFFANPSGDAEGKVYLGSKTVTPTTTGTQLFTFTTTTTVTGTYPLITATLTDSADGTSEFSLGIPA